MFRVYSVLERSFVKSPEITDSARSRTMSCVYVAAGTPNRACPMGASGIFAEWMDVGQSSSQLTPPE